MDEHIGEDESFRVYQGAPMAIHAPQAWDEDYTVAGVRVAALIIEENGGSMHPAQIEAVLKQSADDLGKPGKDDFYGHGLVNAYKAVT